MDKNYVELFYAVTTNSIFLVKDKDENGYPYVEMIASDGNTKMTVGQRLIADNDSRKIVVIFYELSMTTIETYAYFIKTCNPELHEDRMRVKDLGGHSGSIVALFRTENEAQQCYAEINLQPCDPRWLTETKQVLVDIGPNHPDFKIATEDYRLLLD